MTRDTIGRPMEILLVEDDLEDAGMTIDVLRQGNVPCRVSLVRDGEEAIEFLLRRDMFRRAPQPDVILLDLNLPKKSGPKCWPRSSPIVGWPACRSWS